jgi:hypothetical protein
MSESGSTPDKERLLKASRHILALVYMTWALCAFLVIWITLHSPQTPWLRMVELVLTDGIFLSVILGFLHYDFKGDNILAEVLKATAHADIVNNR